QNTNDYVVPPTLLSQIFSALSFKLPILTTFTSGSGTYTMPFKFQIVSGNATVGATYTNNGFTYTVYATIAAGLELVAQGPGAPTSSGILTKTSGTGDATITFNAVRAPSSHYVEVIGSGGGGGGCAATSSSQSAAGAGGGGGGYTRKL